MRFCLLTLILWFTLIPDLALAQVTSQLRLTSATTAYSANQLIASSATASAVVVPSFKLPNAGNGSVPIPRVRLSTNDATTTAWGAASVQIDLWSVAPTFTNGDRAAFVVATGAAGHLGSFSCIMSAEGGDGAYAACAPIVGSFVTLNMTNQSLIYWTLEAISVSGVTGASKIFTLTPELLN